MVLMIPTCGFAQKLVRPTRRPHIVAGTIGITGMDREYTVRIGSVDTAITVRQIGAASWLAQAKRLDGEVVEFSGDDASYAVERVKLALLESDLTTDDAI